MYVGSGLTWTIDLHVSLYRENWINWWWTAVGSDYWGRKQTITAAANWKRKESTDLLICTVGLLSLKVLNEQIGLSCTCRVLKRDKIHESLTWIKWLPLDPFGFNAAEILPLCLALWQPGAREISCEMNTSGKFKSCAGFVKSREMCFRSMKAKELSGNRQSGDTEV